MLKILILILILFIPEPNSLNTTLTINGVNININLQNNSEMNYTNETLSNIITQVLIQNNSTNLSGKTILVNVTSSSTVKENVTFQPGPVVWRENRPPGNIVKLEAKDNDGPENGAPFKFQIASSASPEIQSKFGVSGKLNCCYSCMICLQVVRSCLLTLVSN